MSQQKLNQSLQVAQLYYMEGVDQAQIAEALSISRPTVSRLLQYARDHGVIHISVEHPVASAKQLAQDLTKKYGKQFHVVPDAYKGHSEGLKAIGAYAGDYLLSILKEDDQIGIGWGQTLYTMSQELSKPRRLPSGLSVVQIKGGTTHSQEHTYAYESLQNFSQKLQAEPWYLPLPAIFEQLMTKEIVEEDRFLQEILHKGKETNIAIYTVGAVNEQALLFQLQYLSQKEKDDLKQHAVADVISRFIDSKGAIVNPDLNERTVGLSLEDLRKKEHSILLASGLIKAAGVHAALCAELPNTVIIDRMLAQQLLKL